MATQVQVPALGESVTQAVLIKWHKADGDPVKPDEAIAELETDKANVDVPSPGGGVLRHLKEEGDTVAVGEAIARIDEGGTPKAPPTTSPTATSDKNTAMPNPAQSSDAESAVTQPTL